MLACASEGVSHCSRCGRAFRVAPRNSIEPAGFTSLPSNLDESDGQREARSSVKVTFMQNRAPRWAGAGGLMTWTPWAGSARGSALIAKSSLG